MNLKRAVALATFSSCVSFGVVAIPAFASSNTTVKAVTHVMNHQDTTSVAGPCTLDTNSGPVWAYDNLSLQLAATPTDNPGNYSVTITAHGSFSAMSNPVTGECSNFSGSVDGSITYLVHSTTAPDPANLPSQSDGSLHQGQILNQFFGGNATITGGGSYSYTYNRVNGGKYIQTG
jgi:hypothetical protein